MILENTWIAIEPRRSRDAGKRDAGAGTVSGGDSGDVSAVQTRLEALARCASARPEVLLCAIRTQRFAEPGRVRRVARLVHDFAAQKRMGCVDATIDDRDGLACPIQIGQPRLVPLNDRHTFGQAGKYECVCEDPRDVEAGDFELVERRGADFEGEV